MPGGPRPKPEGTRTGHGSIKSTKALLPADSMVKADIPPLPAHPLGVKWHVLALKTWADLWHSPMASQYVEADVAGLFRIVVLTQAFMTTPTASISAELRQLSFNYGLSPMDRRRLQWTIVKTEDALQDAVTRRERRAKQTISGDPRDALK